ncbi:MAG: urease accessory protein UreD [Ferrovibrio sp.]|uniref:urease accessory protein UreD n=1 Tax=Ferrovibrio sp. TaxID=1917215 RepID=UPI00261AE24A|nr:urease accessory protein UreD [Ferrovibrio sp.]MCW0234865.1 urease accessory protein UreD [Ferrovibrio sp.]
MTAAPAPRLQRADGALRLRFADDAGTTRLADLYQSDPCRALLPASDPGEPLTAILITTAGGLTGGDRLRLAAMVDAGADALCTPQAAEKIYRAADQQAAAIDLTLEVGANAALEWLPQEMILFDGARLERRVGVALAAGARLLAGDITVFGRTAHGERFAGGSLFDRWQVRRDGRLVWTDSTRLEGDTAALLDHPAGFAGAVAQALILYQAPDAVAARDRLRSLEIGEPHGPGNGNWGATVIDGLLLVRLLDRDAARLRRVFAHLWSALRPGLGHRPAMPRLWRF